MSRLVVRRWAFTAQQQDSSGEQDGCQLELRAENMKPLIILPLRSLR